MDISNSMVNLILILNIFSLKCNKFNDMSLLQALTHVKDIELRLNGIIKTKRKQQGLPLSIEGQVNHLILVCISFCR